MACGFESHLSHFNKDHMSNKLCYAIASNKNTESKFSSFELLTVREYIGEEGGTYIDEIKTAAEFFFEAPSSIDDPFYQICGTYKDSSKRRFISEFYSLDMAISFLQDLTGEENVKITLY